MPNVVFDASVLVSAILKQDSLPEKALLLAREVDCITFSIATLAEIKEVMSRPFFARFVSDSKREEFLSLLCSRAAFFEPSETIHDCRDAKDNKYLELAVESHAAIIISGDEDLLILNPYRGISVVNPSGYIRLRTGQK